MIKIFGYIIPFAILWSCSVLQAQQSTDTEMLPFSTDSTHLTVWNGEEYVPFFVKGVNLGIAVPGTFPGQLTATKEQYQRWFQMIREAGFNTIRIYTLHFPRFYEALYDFNTSNPNSPIFFFQGIWLEENIVGYDDDLYFLTTLFDSEIEENIHSVHGNISIPERQGKAYGTYTVDVSQWMIGYIIGREVHPPEILTTNNNNPEITGYNGEYFSITDVSASEAWVAGRLDHLVTFEENQYGTQRPVSFSSWPTLDPIEHPFEENEFEEMASLDLSGLDINLAEAGFFVSYHAYPYYPDYISRDPRYTSFSDHLGQNSYLGYLTYLKDHYPDFPLVIAEFGAPSSWGVAHYAQNGIHHGGHDEKEQGEHAVRLLQNINMAGGGGGIQFSWLDEWFKRTWITDPRDFNPDRRVYWHNISAAEQNFGLLGFKKENLEFDLVEEFCTECPVTGIEAAADYAYLNVTLNTESHLSVLDTLWLTLDTYDSELGESILPGGQTVNNRVEFVLMITNYKAELYVTEAYDLFGIWHNISEPEQQYRSTVTDGAPWRIVRWRNNYFENEVQYIGSMRVNRLDMPKSSLDAVRLYDDRIEIRLPWTLINFTDPSLMEVMHDDRNTTETETRISDGISFGIFYNDFSVETSQRFIWDTWDFPFDAEEYKKESYAVVKENLRKLPGDPIAVADEYEVAIGSFTHSPAEEGVLSNDLSPDGSSLTAVLSTTPDQGFIELNPDGSFHYRPEEGRTGTDYFTYRAQSAFHQSKPVTVQLNISGTPVGRGFAQVYPNPTSGQIQVHSSATIDHLTVYSVLGQTILSKNVNSTETTISLNEQSSGVYFIRLFSGNEFIHKKIMLVR